MIPSRIVKLYRYMCKLRWFISLSSTIFSDIEYNFEQPSSYFLSCYGYMSPWMVWIKSAVLLLITLCVPFIEVFTSSQSSIYPVFMLYKWISRKNFLYNFRSHLRRWQSNIKQSHWYFIHGGRLNSRISGDLDQIKFHWNITIVIDML